METGEVKMDTLREYYHEVFYGTPHGRQVLTSMLQSLGYWEQDERDVDPKLTAFANRLLYMCKAFDVTGESQYEMIRRMG